MNSSVVFARWHQCAFYLTHASLGLTESKSQTASPSVQPFLHSSRQTESVILYNGPPPSPLNGPLMHGGLFCSSGQVYTLVPCYIPCVSRETVQDMCVCLCTRAMFPRVRALRWQEHRHPEHAHSDNILSMWHLNKLAYRLLYVLSLDK